jgi:hypothetical protein
MKVDAIQILLRATRGGGGPREAGWRGQRRRLPMILSTLATARARTRQIRFGPALPPPPRAVRAVPLPRPLVGGGIYA